MPGGDGLSGNSSHHESTPLVQVLEAETTTPTTSKHEDEDEDKDPLQVLARARRLLYVSHFFAQFSEVSWQFALILFLAAITNYESLVLVSTYGLTTGLVVCLFGAATGRRVVDDRSHNRLVVARTLIWCENVSVIVATAFCYLLLVVHRGEVVAGKGGEAHPEQVQEVGEWWSLSWLLQRLLPHVPLDPMSVACLVCLHVFGPLAQILDRGFLVAIERDWVVVMSQVARGRAYGGSSNGHAEAENGLSSPLSRQQAWLSETNVTMRQIDLSCKVAAPSIAGFIIGAFDNRDAAAASSSSRQHNGSDLTGAALLVGFLNMAALVVQYVCTSKIYYMIPALAVKEGSLPLPSSPAHTTNGNSAGHHNHYSSSARATSATSPFFRGIWKLPPSLQVYLDQPIAPAGLGLALLYLNALTFGGLMTAYLVWRGMRLETVGIWRGVSSAVGLAGTLLYHISVKHSTVVSTGMWSVCFQFVMISFSFAALFEEDYDTSMPVLIFGVCFSRIGLWVFDIAVTQLMQEFIPDGIRGVVGGTQQSLNAFFTLSSFALGLIFPDPKEFHVYVAAGYAAVGGAALLYAFGVYRKANDFLMQDEA